MGDGGDDADTLRPPPADPWTLQQARMQLHLSAISARRYMSAAEWEDDAIQSDAGRLVGPRTIEAIWRSVWRL